MANVILGLLLLRAMSLYDLLRAFEAGVSLFYSASSGSLKRALDGLLANGCVEVDEVRPGTRGRKVYRVTPEGRAAFHDWMCGEVAESDGETGFLARLYFLGLVDGSDRARVLGNIRSRVERDLRRLESLEAQVAEAEISPDLAEVAAYQMLTLSYGLAAHRFTLDWLTESLPDDRGVG